MFFSVLSKLVEAPLYYIYVIFLGIVASLVATISGIVLYRLTLHPLAQYPGPTLARITDFYSVYQAWKGTRHLDLYNLHQRYGPIVRYGPNSISFSSNTALHEIYGFKGNVKKAHFYSAFPATKDAWSTHSAIDKNLHARKRRVLSQAFSDSAMKGLQPHILSVIRTFCEAVADFPAEKRMPGNKLNAWSTPKNMAQWSNYVVYDVLGDICYGQSFDTLLREDNRFAVKLVGLSSKFHYLMGQMPVLKKLGLDRVLFKDLRANRQRFMAYSRSRLAERMTLGTDNDRRDFFYYLLKAKDPETGVGFQTQELWGESNVLLIAGSDTTSTALASTLYYLLHNSSTLTTLTSEIRAAFSTLESIVLGPSLTACRYLRACIDESMRLSPPVPAILPREILPGGMHIAGQLFPAGTVVGVSAYTLHHNPAYYPAPFAFRPERWLGSAGSETNDGTLEINEGGVEKAAETALAQSAFCPFSLGARGCIGKGVAYLELGIALARLLWLYDLRLTPGYEGVGSGPEGNYALKDIFVGLKDGPIVEFRGRK